MSDHSSILIRRADCILTSTGRFNEADQLIRDGRIAAIGAVPEVPADARILEGRGRLVATGPINTHWHSPMQLSHGTSDRINHKVFMWENQVGTAKLSMEEIEVSAQICCLQMLKSGTTAVIDYFPEQGFGIDDAAAIVRPYERCGMRSVVALRIFDGEYSDILPSPALGSRPAGA